MGDETLSLGGVGGNDEEDYSLNKDEVMCIESLGGSLGICIWFPTEKDGLDNFLGERGNVFDIVGALLSNLHYNI
ncbi:hypothetical protein F8M41_025025 [Gigaspora margarita]|uniref:Uncharacterized protein n=1 Tax=Gigaspora margarita TaxID=4874 RepID=A0A8H4ABQ8_GIGMA|nr:hypothetical protein F8M41_025025 [Gigaspora margarita]